MPFHLLLERNTDSGAGNEVFLATISSFADLLSANLAGGAFSQLDIAPAFSAGGLAAEMQPVAATPKPATLALLGVAFAGFGFSCRRKLH